jgi:hypothetical protein
VCAKRQVRRKKALKQSSGFANSRLQAKNTSCLGEHLVCSPCGAVASSIKRVISVERKADAGGVAVALAVTKSDYTLLPVI